MMEYEVQTVIGPRTASVSRSDALTALQTHRQYPKGAILSDFGERNGEWVAELKVPKTAGPFPPGNDEPAGPPSGPDEGPPKDEGPPSDEDSPLPDDGGDEGPPKPDGEGKEKKPSVEESIAHLTDIVTALADALGVGPGGPPGHPGAGPEAEDPMGPPPPGPPGPPHGGGGGKGPGGQSAMMRSRPLKPGEAPNSPGVTPVGAPAFASVQDDHPWKHILGKTANFTVTNPIENVDDPKIVSQAAIELNELAGNVWDSKESKWVPGPNATGYNVRQVRVGTNEQGEPEVKALISAR